MITIPTLSFCITCKNRFHQISQTLRQNLEDNKLHSDFIEFVLIDFGSIDGLRNWVLVNFNDELEQGYLRYYYTEELPDWKVCIAKNTAHWMAKNDIVVNLDCDNYTGFMGGQFVIRKFIENQNIVLHQFNGDYEGGSFGRIAVLKKYFDRIAGYDESFAPMGYEDNDLIIRLHLAGLKYSLIPNICYTRAIANTRAESIANTNSLNDWEAMQRFNMHKSYLNSSNYCLEVNDRTYGIRKNLYDHHGQLYLDYKSSANNLINSL